MAAPRYLPAGDSALVVEFGATADAISHARVVALDAALSASPIDGVREHVPTYRSLMIHYDPRRLAPGALIAAIEALALVDTTLGTRRSWRLPVCYDGPYGEDLDEVAAHLGRAREDVANAHATGDYAVVMYGFAPGFVFLSGLPDNLAISRRRTPRPPAPAGALTIANGQALIASVAMPTGWYMLGRTPARTFDLRRDPAFPLGVGDRVRFDRIDPPTFERLEHDAEQGGDLIMAEV